MACCGANAPKPDQPSPAPRPGESEQGPLTLTVGPSGSVIGGHRAGNWHATDGHTLDLEAAHSTLLAQHVLLQI